VVKVMVRVLAMAHAQALVKADHKDRKVVTVNNS
jgi:hypothetical protein